MTGVRLETEIEDDHEARKSGERKEKSTYSNTGNMEKNEAVATTRDLHSLIRGGG